MFAVFLFSVAINWYHSLVLGIVMVTSRAAMEARVDLMERKLDDVLHLRMEKNRTRGRSCRRSTPERAGTSHWREGGETSEED